MPVWKPKIPETLEFVEGLLSSTDAIDKALPGTLGKPPRRALFDGKHKIANFKPEYIQELGQYQGRVVLAALAAELALKFAWESENPGRGAALGGHKLLECFNQLSADLKEEIRKEYQRRAGNSSPKEWRTVDQVFTICNETFEVWRYLVEKGNIPDYTMQAKCLNDATRSVISICRQKFP